MKTLLKTRFVGILVSCLFAFSLFSGAAQSAQPKQILTISVSSYAKLLEAGKTITNLVNQGDAFEMFQSNFGTLAGVDNAKPLGITLFATDEEFLPVAFLPVTDLEKLIEQFPALEDMLDNGELVSEGKYSFPGPAGNLLLEQKKGWLVLYPESQAGLLGDDPSKLLNGLDKEYQLAFHVNFENMPKELVLQMIASAEMILSMFNPDAAQQFATVKEQVELLLDEGKWFLEGLKIDAKTGNVIALAEMEVKSTGTLAESIKYIKSGKTNFIGFYRPDQAAASVGIGMIPDSQKESQINIIQNYFAGAKENLEYDLEGDDLELVQGIVDSLEQVAIATIEEGKTDVAATWASGGDILFAGHIAKGNLLSDTLKKAIKGISDVTPEMKDLFKSEYATFEGYKFSSVAVPMALVKALAPNADEMPDELAEKTLCLLLGVKDDAVCAVFGTNASKQETLLKKCITDSKTAAALPKQTFVASLPLVAGALKSFGLAGIDPQVDAVLDSLAKAPKDAKITLDNDVVIGSQGIKNGVKFNISGKIISEAAKAFAAAQEAEMQSSLDSDPFEKSENGNSEKAKDFKF